MPYNKPSLRGFIAWLETKDPKEEYDYCDVMRCAVARWLIAIGKKDVIVLPDEFREKVGFPEGIVNDIDQTFGGALRRARASLVK